VLFTLHVAESAQPLEEFLSRSAGLPWNTAGHSWATPEGTLKIDFARKPAAVAEQDRAYCEYRNGEPVPILRLSERKLL
jgi:hypothetical protein